MKGFFGNFFGDQPKPEIQAAPARPPLPQNKPHNPAESYKKGDVVAGKYEIQGRLGEGGFGIVFLAYNRETHEVCALKTFKDELLANPTARQAFRREALLWVNLDRHPFILSALWVDEASGRLFVAMEYIAPAAQGCVTLAERLARGEMPDTNQTLKWAIQFCLGMEHAGTKGLQCHRDIKPANILITSDGTFKISDFGLAAAAEVASRESQGLRGSLVTGNAEHGFGFSLFQNDGKFRCGTPGYMPPEVYRGERADARSDIYSFGLVLWQMAARSHMPPFAVPWRGNMENYLRGIYEQQMAGRAPQTDGPLTLVIDRCLRSSPPERYGSFRELRNALEVIWTLRTGKKFEIPELEQQTAGFWTNKGAALDALGRYEEAISCFDKALVIDRRHASAWNNKSNAYHALGRYEEAIGCCDKALMIDPRNAGAWTNKGSTLRSLSRNEEAIGCYDKSLAIDPQHPYTWTCKGNVLQSLSRHEDAIACYTKALAIDPGQSGTWNNKGGALQMLGRHEEAIGCHDKALAIDPLDAKAWYNRGYALRGLVRREDEIGCYEKALAINPRYVAAWYNKALAEDALTHWRKAIGSYQKFVELAPPQHAQQVARSRQRIQELSQALAGTN